MSIIRSTKNRKNLQDYHQYNNANGRVATFEEYNPYRNDRD